MFGSKMATDGRTARQLFEEVFANPGRRKFGFGTKLAIVNVDVQQAYTRPDMFKTAYETDPRQIEHINTISKLAREKDMPVVWSRVAYCADGSDCGVWGTIHDGEDALQNVKPGSPRHAFDPRCEVDENDYRYDKRMPSAFFDTQLANYLRWKQVDTVVVTGGSTSGCVRATAVDSLSYGFRTIVPIETTADRHESFHFGSLMDLHLKYADVEPVQVVIDWLNAK
jgi:maleamate amidohydrolase